MSATKWTYDREHGEVLDQHNRPVLYVSASHMDFDDVEGRLGAATKIGLLAAAAPDLAAALEAATAILAASLADAQEGDAVDMELTPDGSVKLSDCFAALARAKGAS